MTEQEIHALAERYGMTVDKRITTGNATCHFAIFELHGLRANEVWACVVDSPGLHQLAAVSNPGHPDHGKLYVRFESVWCEVEGGAA